MSRSNEVKFCTRIARAYFSRYRRLIIESLSKDVFEQRTLTGSEDFSLVICLDAM